MPWTRVGLMVRSSPPTSMVPPKRRLPPIGVMATFASAKIEQSCGSSGGEGRVSEYPLPACSGSFRPTVSNKSALHEPPAITNLPPSKRLPPPETARHFAVAGFDAVDVHAAFDHAAEFEDRACRIEATKRAGLRWQSCGKCTEPATSMVMSGSSAAVALASSTSAFRPISWAACGDFRFLMQALCPSCTASADRVAPGRSRHPPRVRRRAGGFPDSRSRSSSREAATWRSVEFR